MANVEQDYAQNVLELIDSGSHGAIDNFKPHQGDYVRMVVEDEEGDLIRTYYSNRTWDNKLV